MFSSRVGWVMVEKGEIQGNDPEVIHFLWHQSQAKIMILKVGSRGSKKICPCDVFDINKIFKVKDMNREGTEAQNSMSWKIQVFQSILRSKLLYGLETIQLNQSELHRLDAFQIKGYRKILHIPPTSVDRTMTNASVKELIQSHYGVTVIEFSKLWLKRKFQLLGHIIRSDPQDPMRQVLFLPISLVPRTEHARRVGKPRAHWLIETYADAYRESGHVDQFDINNILQRNLVNELAQQRLNMFSWHSIAHLFTESFITESFVTESFVIESGHIPGPASEIIDVYTPFLLLLLLFLPPCLIIWFFPPIPWLRQKTIMVLKGWQVQFQSAKQRANSWILHSAAAAACAKQTGRGCNTTNSWGCHKLWRFPRKYVFLFEIQASITGILSFWKDLRHNLWQVYASLVNMNGILIDLIGIRGIR